MNEWRKSSYSFSNGNCAEVRAWRKSSASNANGNCAEVGTWRTSSRSGGAGECAEVGQDGTVMGVRDSKDPGGPVLVVGAAAWEAFLARVRSA